MQITVAQDALQLVEKMFAVVAVLQNAELHVLQIAQENVLAIAPVLVKTLLLHVEQVVPVTVQKIALQVVPVDAKAYVLLDVPILVEKIVEAHAETLAEQVVLMNLVKAVLDNVLKDVEILAL